MDITHARHFPKPVTCVYISAQILTLSTPPRISEVTIYTYLNPFLIVCLDIYLWSMEGSSKGLRKGAWTAEEDSLLRQCIGKYGEGKWHQVPLRAGMYLNT